MIVFIYNVGRDKNSKQSNVIKAEDQSDSRKSCFITGFCIVELSLSLYKQKKICNEKIPMTEKQNVFF